MQSAVVVSCVKSSLKCAWICIVERVALAMKSGQAITELDVRFLQRLHKSMLQASWAGLSKQLPGLLISLNALVIWA